MEDVQERLRSISSSVDADRIRYTNKLFKYIAELRLLYLQKKINFSEYNELYNNSGFRLFLSFETSQYIEDVLYNRYRLVDIYERIVKMSKRYKTEIKDLDALPNIEKELIEFFKYMNCYKLYETLRRKHMIIHGETFIKTGSCINAGKYSYICLLEPYDRKYRPQEITVAHEMGHAYNTFCLAGEKMPLFQLNISSEIMSICFEKLFFDFLRERGSINKELLDSMITSTETIFIKKADSIRRVLDYFDIPEQETSVEGINLLYIENGKKQKFNVSSQAYVIGDLASSKLFSDYERDRDYFISHLPEVIKEINRMSFDEILDEYAKVDSLKDYYDKHLVLKPNKKNA